MSDYKTGERLRSRVSSAQFVVVSAAAGTAEITCGGEPLARDGEDISPGAGASTEGPKIEIGKRYEDEAATVELLCVSAGVGDLEVAGSPLQLKMPKPLPASD
ncbi:hypothetical protein HQ305_21370 [Rhodococcus sp. BP-149]|uniref:hypothetical protein n=1 Tax=unclassified Rhodococcus (in: high G+C Gram-positive bacteria) TaxID=192944 RepID=UPI001C9B56EC|nr:MULTISPECIES: hypothetical protein [unclassified Rhodococcus (in: high G+C Gram-positive bacteria)]MBY6687786.1 hypothetical protein [Rhodococcus sp. BP-288]MBY6696051.1 hypothetical protein [Rhodococcus sp. BP-188]MBY6700648.1 hypothetical protein [Rhodococcus sp. BP-285]MBY6705045.1 hypothetical protein [Rhodococcus sp. BP-283]MBY6713773.1 hypothetical protein [Rhodococcus sp. BP-160]